MKRPGWTTVVGVLMILIGGCGTTNDIKQLFTDDLMELQNDFAIEIDTNTEANTEIDSAHLALLEKLSVVEGDTSEAPLTLGDHLKKMSHIPETVVSKLKLHGYIGIVISLLYAIVGLLFIIKRKHVLLFAYTILVASLLFTIYQYIDISQFAVSKILKVGLQFTIAFGGLLDIVILIILAFVDKSYFNIEETYGDYYDSPDPQT